MQWFRNLNARPRLMIGFGLLVFIILVISFLAIQNQTQANKRLDTLYSVDVIGAERISDSVINIITIRGNDLNAFARANDLPAVEASEKDELAVMAELHANLDAAQKLFLTRRGQELLDIVRKTLPDYERAQSDLFRSLKVKDMEGATKALAEAVKNRTIIVGALEEAKKTKEARVQQALEEADKSDQAAKVTMISASALATALGVLLAFIIARGFSVPLGQAVDALERVAGGDLTATMVADTRDEVGRMATALNEALERLRSTLEQVQEGAVNANSASQELASASQTIASGAQEQAASLEETAASLEEITATVRQSADNARQASQLASSSRDSAEQGQQVVSNAVTAMAEINAASAKIADIISTIDEIAFQTNLLAVNAAVEAARAGEEGRGFAVVAAEVRSLAQRSAEAAKEIKGLIQDSLRKVERGTELVNKSGETLQGIVSSVKRVTDIVGEIAAAAGEQSTGIEQVNTAMTQMDQVTQGNSAQTEELSSTAESLSEQASRLMELVQVFTLSKAKHDSGLSSALRRNLTVSHPAPVRQAASLRHGASQPAARKVASAKVAVPKPQPVAASTARNDDPSFEEF
jgi:methyl-accepting chemotaxis protein